MFSFRCRPYYYCQKIFFISNIYLFHHTIKECHLTPKLLFELATITIFIHIFYQGMTDKKLIASFRNFVDKIFLPTLKKTDPAFLEWNKFNQLLSIDVNNYQEAIQYVDSISAPSSSNAFTPLEKRQIPLFKKRVDNQSLNGNNNEGGSFNPSKTFGGERARMMFMKGEEDFNEQKSGFGFGTGRNNQDKRNQSTNPQVILPGLERLCKTFLENQGRIENLLNTIKPSKYG